MAHIHIKPGQHDHTVSGFIIRVDGDEPKVLLHRHKKLNKLLQFGGHIELNENPWQAISHEILEESGYEMSQLKILQPKVRLKYKTGNSVIHPIPIDYNTHKFDDTHNHTNTSYAFITDQKPAQTPAENESTQIKLYSRKQILALSEEETYEDIREICRFIFDDLLGQWEPIPTENYLYSI